MNILLLYGGSDHIQINVDNGMPFGVGPALYSGKRPDITAEEIVEGVYKAYR